MANTTLVSSTVRDVNAIPTVVDTTARSTVRSSMKQTTPFTSKRETNASGLEIYTKSYEMDGKPSLYRSQEDQVLLQVQIGLEEVD